MGKIVFVNQDVGYLMIDVLNAFVEKGYECVLITGRIVERKTPLNEKVKVEKIKQYKRDSLFKRINSWTIGTFQIWFKILFKYRKDKIFLVTNPPTAPLLPLVMPNQYYQLCFDLGIVRVFELGFVKKSKLLTKFWSRIVTKVMTKAIRVFTLTDGMAEGIQPYSKDKEVLVMPLWTDNSEFKPINNSDNPFIQNNEILKDKFIVMYSGNIGTNSGVENIIDIANEVQNKDVLFLIIGEGLRKEAAMRKAKEYGLTNCVFMPWQEPVMFPFSLAAADIAIVSLIGSEAKRSIPSKLFNNMSVGNPILGIASEDSDLSKIINRYEIGKTFDVSQVQEIVSFINDFMKDKQQHDLYSKNALNAAKDFTTSNINVLLENL